MTGRLTALGSVLAAAGAAHSVLNARLLRRPGAIAGPLPQASVLVPARDEAHQILGCISTLAGQDGACEILVLDDESTDGTGDLARAEGVPVLRGTPRPPGWLGKPWACAQLAAAADPASSVLVFVDADVRLSPGAVRAAVGLLQSSGLDLVCPFPRQLAETPAERLVQPLLLWSWLTMLPLRVAERSPRPSLTAATGQFLLIRRDALERAGGFGAVRGAVLDDLALARAVKASGGRGGVVDGSMLATCRMYDDWPALREGYGKSLWSAFGSPAGAMGAVTLLAVIYVLPAAAALRGSRVGAAGWAAGVASRVIASHVSGGRGLPDALAQPISVAMLGYLTLRSLAGHRRGTLRWKARPVVA